MHRKLREEEGFTLIEMITVVIILGVLLAIAVPAYLSFRDRATNTSAQANIRAAVPGVEAFGLDHQGDYTGMTLAVLNTDYDSGIKHVDVYGGSPTGYCISSKVGAGPTFYKGGPDSPIVSAPKPAAC
jgi:type IV pilus assembly protein PilA